MYETENFSHGLGDILKLENKLDGKVFILYLMNKVDAPLEYTTVNDIVLQDEFVNYFDFALCFSELLDAGQVEEAGSIGDIKLYRVSKSGKESLASYESSLLSVIRDHASKSVRRFMAYKREGRRTVSEITPCGEGYMLKCEIYDREKKLFSTEIYISELADAEEIKDNFKDRDDIILKSVQALISGKVNYIFE